MINDHLSLSPQATQLLKAVETLSPTPYDDATKRRIYRWCKGATIGYGHLISQSEWPCYEHGISKPAADRLFEQDMLPKAYAVKRFVTKPLSQQEFDALVILTFNIGITALKQSSAVKLLNDPQAVTPYPTLDAAWSAFNKSQGKINDGLINRRKCELKIFHLGIYERW